MVELLTDMWIYLAGAGVIGLILGWAFRGAFLPRPKTVNVSAPSKEAGPAQFTAEQSALLQKAEQADATISALEMRVKTAQEAAAEYQAELRAARAEAQTLEEKLSEAGKMSQNPVNMASVGAGIAGLAGGLAAARAVGDEAEPAKPDNARDIWRTRYLESRVRFLESKLESEADAELAEPAMPVLQSEDNAELEETKARLASAEARLESLSMMESQVQDLKLSLESVEDRYQDVLSERDALQARLDEAAEQGDSPVVAGAIGAAVGGAAMLVGDVALGQAAVQTESDLGTNHVELAKLKWQNKYLRARTLFLEENMSSEPVSAAPAGTPEPAPDTGYEIESLQSEITVLKAELGRVMSADNEAEKELARLRWRNRYLEGRLKYLDAAALDAESDADDGNDEVAAALEVISRSVENQAVTEYDEPEGDIAPVFEIAPRGEQVLESGSIPKAEDMPFASMSSDDVEEVRPPSLEAPHDHLADDLKRIGGIGPKIEGILNELGVFHYAQIADWSEGETAWIDSYLRFQGRVQREKWVDQAAALAKAETRTGG